MKRALKTKGKLLVVVGIVICFGIIGFILIIDKQDNRYHSCESASDQLADGGRNLSKNITEDLDFSKNHPVSEGLTVHNTKKFFDEYLFQKGIAETGSTNPTQGKVVGAVVPHHLIPSFIIADIFERIANQGTKTIILLSPNHHDIGDTPVLTSEIAWDTPAGKILPKIDVIQKLIQKDYISIDEDVLDNEHGIVGLLPFVAHYDSTIQIVPLALRQNMTKEEINDLVKAIGDIADENTVVVASVDFSHYLNSMQAEKNDVITKQAIKNKNYEKILQMNSNYMDSPQAIVTLLQSMEHMNINSTRILYNTNSGKLMDEPYGETTSYFGIVFMQ